MELGPVLYLDGLVQHPICVHMREMCFYDPSDDANSTSGGGGVDSAATQKTSRTPVLRCGAAQEALQQLGLALQGSHQGRSAGAAEIQTPPKNWRRGRHPLSAERFFLQEPVSQPYGFLRDQLFFFANYSKL